MSWFRKLNQLSKDSISTATAAFAVVGSEITIISITAFVLFLGVPGILLVMGSMVLSAPLPTILFEYGHSFSLYSIITTSSDLFV